MKRQFVWLIMICALLSILVSCGAKEMPDVDKGEEISARFAQDYNQHQFISIDVSVDSVQRDSEGGTEETWGQVVGETETIIMTCPYYSKHSYEEGSWSLKQLRFGDAEFEIKVEPITENDLEVDVGTALLSDYCNDALSINNIVINDRGTDYDLLEETISFTVNVSEPDAYGWFDIAATYSLGTADWELEDWYTIDSGFEVVTCSIPEDIACSDMEEFYFEHFSEQIDDCIFTGGLYNDDLKYAQLEFRIVQEFGYYSQQKRATLLYDYSMKDGWIATQYPVNAADEFVGAWDIVGEWSYSDSKNDMWINIISVDTETVTFEYKISTQRGEYASTTPITETWSRKSDNDIESVYGANDNCEQIYKKTGIISTEISDDNDNDYYIFLYPYKGVCVNLYGWLPGDKYILTYSNTEKTIDVRNDPDALWPGESKKLFESGVVHRENQISTSESLFDYGINYEHEVGDINHKNVLYYADKYDNGPASNTYNLYGLYNTLTGTVFMPDGAEFGLHGYIKIYGDGELLFSYDAADFSESHYVEDFSIDVTGVYELKVEATGESYQYRTWGVLVKNELIALSDLTAHIDKSLPRENLVAVPENEGATADTKREDETAEKEKVQTQETLEKDNASQLMLLKTITESQFGDTVLTTEIQYNDNNEPYKTHCISLSGGYDSDVSYDVDTSSATESCYQETMEGNGDAGSQWFFKDGCVVQRYDFYANGENQWINYEYDESGVLQAASSTASLGGSFVCVFRYDENGELYEYARDETNNWGDKFVNKYTVENIKDASGNLVQRRYYEDGELAIEQSYQDGHLIETNNIQAEYKTTYEYESITVNESDLPRWYYDSTLLLP